MLRTSAQASSLNARGLQCGTPSSMVTVPFARTNHADRLRMQCVDLPWRGLACLAAGRETARPHCREWGSRARYRLPERPAGPAGISARAWRMKPDPLARRYAASHEQVCRNAHPEVMAPLRVIFDGLSVESSTYPSLSPSPRKRTTRSASLIEYTPTSPCPHTAAAMRPPAIPDAAARNRARGNPAPSRRCCGGWRGAR